MLYNVKIITFTVSELLREKPNKRFLFVALSLSSYVYRKVTDFEICGFKTKH